MEELSIEVDVDKLEANAIKPRYTKRIKEKETVGGDLQGKNQNKSKGHVVSEKGLVAYIIFWIKIKIYLCISLELFEFFREQALKNKKKKKKKNPAPKNFQPGFVPDPERWIPLRERSTYKKRRKDKRKLMKGPQGTASSSNADNQ